MFWLMFLAFANISCSLICLAPSCAYREREEGRSGDATITREEWLESKRHELHSRMRSRRSTRRGGRSSFRSIF